MFASCCPAFLANSQPGSLGCSGYGVRVADVLQEGKLRKYVGLISEREWNVRFIVLASCLSLLFQFPNRSGFDGGLQQWNTLLTVVVGICGRWRGANTTVYLQCLSSFRV
jgi:hypothetical protein